MPAAAKVEKQPGEITNGKTKNVLNNTNGCSYTSQDPPKIVNSIIEKKIRNLEKRKVRLLELKALEDKGQQLEAEQKIAVKKLENVVEMIDMLKEIGKNVVDGLNDHAKQVKKQQKKEQLEKQAERQQQDLVRLKLLLNAQLLLSRFSQLKTDLVQGENGAIKLDDNQVSSLETLSSIVSPQKIDLIDESADKINWILEGNKRDMFSGISYSDIKETLVKLTESDYFHNIFSFDNVSSSSTEANSDETKTSENDEQNANSNNTANSEIIFEEQTESKPSLQASVHPLPNQLCFMRDPVVVENELQHEDPAVVAVASSGFAYPPQMGQALSTSSGSNIQANSISTQFSPHIYPAVSICSIPSQTFTNTSYTALLPANPSTFIPVTLPAPVTHHMLSEQHIHPIQSSGLESQTFVENENSELGNDKVEIHQETQIEASNLQTNQDSEVKLTNEQIENGQFNKRNLRPNYRGNNRGGYGNYRGRGGKNYGYFNNNGNVPNNSNGSFQNRPINRQNGNANGRPNGAYRQDRPAAPRNPNYNQQAAPVSAK